MNGQHVSVFSPDSGCASCQVKCSFGKEIKSFDSVTNPLFTGNLSAGLYLIKAEDIFGQEKTAKFIVQ